MKLEFSRQIFEEYSDIKFYENPSSGRRVIACGETDMTKVTVVFHNYAKAPKTYSSACTVKESSIIPSAHNTLFILLPVIKDTHCSVASVTSICVLRPV